MNLGRFLYSSMGDTLRFKQGFFNIDIWKISLHSNFLTFCGKGLLTTKKNVECNDTFQISILKYPCLKRNVSPMDE